jgi:predicted amidohydrolase YtcJ
LSLLIENCEIWPEGSGSVLVEDGVIAKVSRGGTQAVPRNAERIDAGGGTLLPGLVDTHCHPFELGWLKRNVDLRGVANITALRLRLAAKIRRSAPGEWVVGMGWDQEAFPDKRTPSKSDIDDVAPANPVILSRVCGHIGLLNRRAIDLLGISDRTGPEYERDAHGDLTGIVMERALVEAYERLPGRSPAKCADDLLAAEVEAARSGLGTLHCILSPEGFREELEALVALRADGKLLLRYRVYIPPEAIDFVEEKKIRERLKGPSVRINGVKLFADGSLGARTAALREPYTDDPANSGLLRYTDEEMKRKVVDAQERGYQVIVHAIGDRAVEQAVDSLSTVTGGGNPRCHRIEHASLLPRDLRSKILKSSIRVAVQPSFITSDSWARGRLGDERVKDLYPLRSIISEGILASGGSDAPVETINPMLGVWSSMVGSDYSPNERLSLEDAIELYTRKGLANGMDESGGEWAQTRKPADLTLLDSEVSKLHPAMLRKVGISATIVGGRVVYSAFGSTR